ncbi:MATH domain and coiled-coil domain-containing protein At3g58270-like [Vigna unguiculata]|uniref:MATH domain and coiled-coil domain-containing protein At3g58270-like n=1 Tax=Vigna unguiculata TaxID=3917 RepID=UPI001016BACE|nr:MATH domain and coiled-coil domain-containing protein At3g58270-like [Vigna unguiculata]
MENENTKQKMFEKFTWTIQDFSKLDYNEYSEEFFLHDHLWRILIYPRGNNVDYLSIYLDGGGNVENLGGAWYKFANFKLTLINQINHKMSRTMETEHLFSAKEIDWGFLQFIPLYELHNPNNGFIVNDTCIVEAEILVSKLKEQNQVDQAHNKTNDKPTKHIDKPLPQETFTTFVELMGLKDIQQDFIPLLEEVCAQHPLLINSQKKRTLMYVEWAFTALGRVLHFLKTKKVKDMNEDACNHLQNLWEELETFKFDLTWLEPHVQSALKMKNYVERSVQVKKKKENICVLEKEIKMLKEKIIETKVNLEITRRELTKISEAFVECDLDDGLGYGGR